MGKGIFIGLDLGGTELKVALGAGDDELLWQARRPSHGSRGGDAILEAIAGGVEEARAQALASGLEARGVGLGTAGVVDPETGRVRYEVANLKDWRGIDLKGFFEERFQLPAVIENDANAAAYGEAMLGAGRGRSLVFMVTAGTGIGAGCVIEGRLLRGAAGAAMEFGHTRYAPGGRACRCGKVGCLEAYAGGWGMARTWEERLAAEGEKEWRGVPLAELGPSQLIEAAGSGEEGATAALEAGATALGEGLGVALHLLNPDLLILGGGFLEGWPRYGERVEEVLEASLLKKAFDPLSIERARFGNRAGVLGAIALAARRGEGSRDGKG
ncbi:MAG: ROK family protein [Planctomycetota bacterium]